MEQLKKTVELWETRRKNYRDNKRKIDIAWISLNFLIPLMASSKSVPNSFIWLCLIASASLAIMIIKLSFLVEKNEKLSEKILLHDIRTCARQELMKRGINTSVDEVVSNKGKKGALDVSVMIDSRNTEAYKLALNVLRKEFESINSDSLTIHVD